MYTTQLSCFLRWLVPYHLNVYCCCGSGGGPAFVRRSAPGGGGPAFVRRSAPGTGKIVGTLPPPFHCP